ncbi:hypothetical protein C8T65DRAFT_700289 [Cerioporus squamosus]|nr:hypothetical protein C8T65DRAFT_700289 [Cerioporus squamosus]
MKPKSKASSSTARRRKQDAELQRLADELHKSTTADDVLRVERAVAQLTLSPDATSTSPPTSSDKPARSPIVPPENTAPSPTYPFPGPSPSHHATSDEDMDALRDELIALQRSDQVLREAHMAFPLAGQTLNFVHDPRTYGDYPRRPITDEAIVNHGPGALRVDASENSLVLRFEHTLVDIFRVLTARHAVSHPDVDALREALLERVRHDLDNLENFKNDEWDRQRQGIPSPDDVHEVSVRTDRLFESSWAVWSSREVVLHTTFLVVLIMHLLEGLTRRACQLLLAGFRATTAVTLLFARDTDTLTKTDTALVDDIVPNPCTILRRYKLEPTLRNYPCCTRCFALYPSDSTLPFCAYKSITSATPADEVAKPCAHILRLDQLHDDHNVRGLVVLHWTQLGAHFVRNHKKRSSKDGCGSH